MSETFRCFVYGTLRSGDYNHERVGGSADHKSATAKGRIYHAYPNHRVYPVANFDEDGVIVGEVHEFSPETWGHIVYMEVGAGYSLRRIEVTYSDGTTEAVFAWHYDRPPGGIRIESGDWFGDDAF